VGVRRFCWGYSKAASSDFPFIHISCRIIADLTHGVKTVVASMKA
jgi:hypothetical protein